MKPDQWIDTEPCLEDLMADPIMQLLLQGDGIDERQVIRAVELARRGLGPVTPEKWLAAVY